MTGRSGRTVTFVTGHYYASPRRAGFHNLADAMYGMGYAVNFVTTGFSLLSYLRRDYRTRIPGIRANWNKAVDIRPGFVSYVYFTAWHPMTLLAPALNRLSMGFMDHYGQGELGDLLELVWHTDVFVFESMAGLFLFRRFRRENAKAAMIYRVSDDVRILGSTHPRLVELEQEIAGDFDCVSVPSSWMLRSFASSVRLRLNRHGLDKTIYDNCACSPYPADSKNAVLVGTGYLDQSFFQAAALAHPDCTLHIIGPMTDTLNLPNVKFYGEMPFAHTIPYVKHADVGLATRSYRQGYAASLTDSLKIIQYRYCGLPIVSPDFIDLNREGVFYYHPGDAASAATALDAAFKSGRNPAYAAEVRTWDEVARDMLVAAGVSV